MNSFIVKVQLPVVSSEADPPALIYNEGRDVHGFMPVTPELKEAMTRDGHMMPKMFFWAHIDENKLLVLEDEAEWQDW